MEKYRIIKLDLLEENVVYEPLTVQLFRELKKIHLSVEISGTSSIN